MEMFDIKSVRDFLEKRYLYFLYIKIHFAQWHLERASERPYAVYLINKINNMKLTGKIVEIGCGLGDILSGLKTRNKVGYDVDKTVIRAAKWVHPLIKTYVGSFEDICGEKISLLITVNFLFSLEEDMFQKCFKTITTQNNISRIVVDDVPCPPYTYYHDYISFFKSIGYELEYKSKGFGAVGGRRHLLFFRRIIE